jgi:hypothetical protein
MAIRIPILTSFDPKGLKQANAAFGKLSASVGSLGRNFAVLGGALAGGTALLGKAVKSASNFEAEFEGVNQVFGDAAKSVQAFAEQASKSAGLSATEALQASKTFGLFATGAGMGAQEAAKFSTTMVQLAGDLGSFNDVDTPEALAAIQSGLMGQSEPLRKFGVFLDDITLKNTLFEETGEKVTGTLTTQQKMVAAYAAILKQTSVQQGDYIKYQDTLGNQLKTVSKDFENLSKDIGLMLIPAITDAMPQIKEMATALGEELKAAIASVDWEALTKSVVDFTRFIVENADTIAKLVAGIFILNTAFKLMTVVSGIAAVALQVKTWWLAQTASGMTKATIATNVFASALRLLPIVAVTVAIIALGTEVANLGPKFEKYKDDLTKANTGMSDFQVEASAAAFAGQDLLTMLSPLNKVVNDLALGIFNLIAQLHGIPREVKTKINVELETNARQGQLDQYLGFLGGRAGQARGAAPTFTASPTPTAGGGASSATRQATVSDVLKREGVLATRETKLLNTGISAGFASLILNTATTKKSFQKELKGLTKSTSAVTKAQAKFNKTAAGRAEVANQAAAASAAASAAAAEFAAAQEAAARAEAEALAERERVYNSFLDSVKNTFAGIKNAILGAFDLGQLGGSTNAITRNMDKLLVRLRSFATNVSKLSGMGLDPALLQQVIAAGPLAGARLAQTLVAGGANALASINAGYNEFGALSSQIAQTGTESLFNREAQQTVYNINVDGGVGSGSTIGKAIVDAIKAYERTSGAVWQGA